MLNGKIHYKWPFSIAMLNYQRVIIRFNKGMDNILYKLAFQWEIHGTFVGDNYGHDFERSEKAEGGELLHDIYFFS